MNTAYDFLREYVPLRYSLKTREDGEFLIASNREENIYYLNGMAREIWYMFDGNISIEGICNKILAEYDAEREIVEIDIIKLIRDLQRKKLIRLKRSNNNEEI